MLGFLQNITFWPYLMASFSYHLIYSSFPSVSFKLEGRSEGLIRSRFNLFLARKLHADAVNLVLSIFHIFPNTSCASSSLTTPRQHIANAPYQCYWLPSHRSVKPTLTDESYFDNVLVTVKLNTVLQGYSHPAPLLFLPIPLYLGARIPLHLLEVGWWW